MLRLGSYGSNVVELQKKLSSAGFEPGAYDGIFGALTYYAVVKFQKAKGLEPDGVVGPVTMKALGLNLGEPKPLSAKLLALKKGTIAWYEQAYREMEIIPGLVAQVEQTTKRVQAGMVRYRDLEAKTGVPAQFIGCLHNMECSNNFRGYLGNGELIIGLGKKSTLVPKGRGPFQTFEEGAIDALSLDGLIGVKNWSLGLELMLAEKYNGTGYLRYHPEENSPYLWASTNINDGFGKYVADGKYDPNAPTSRQVGVAAVYKQLEIWGEFKPVFSTAAIAA